MNNDFLIPLLTIILPLIGGGIGFFIKGIIEKRKDLDSQVTKKRRAHYQDFVNIVIDLFCSKKTGKNQPDEQVLVKLFDFYKKYVLYASPEVINSFSDYFQYLYSTNSDSAKMDYKIHFQKLSRILIEMRKDLGLSNKNLGKDGVRIFRALLTDFDEIMK